MGSTTLETVVLPSTDVVLLTLELGVATAAGPPHLRPSGVDGVVDLMAPRAEK